MYEKEREGTLTAMKTQDIFQFLALGLHGKRGENTAGKRGKKKGKKDGMGGWGKKEKGYSQRIIQQANSALSKEVESTITEGRKKKKECPPTVKGREKMVFAYVAMDQEIMH